MKRRLLQFFAGLAVAVADNRSSFEQNFIGSLMKKMSRLSFDFLLGEKSPRLGFNLQVSKPGASAMHTDFL